MSIEEKCQLLVHLTSGGTNSLQVYPDDNFPRSCFTIEILTTLQRTSSRIKTIVAHLAPPANVGSESVLLSCLRLPRAPMPTRSNSFKQRGSRSHLLESLTANMSQIPRERARYRQYTPSALVPFASRGAHTFPLTLLPFASYYSARDKEKPDTIYVVCLV